VEKPCKYSTFKFFWGTAQADCSKFIERCAFRPWRQNIEGVFVLPNVRRLKQQTIGNGANLPCIARPSLALLGVVIDVSVANSANNRRPDIQSAAL